MPRPLTEARRQQLSEFRRYSRKAMQALSPEEPIYGPVQKTYGAYCHVVDDVIGLEDVEPPLLATRDLDAELDALPLESCRCHTVNADVPVPVGANIYWPGDCGTVDAAEFGPRHHDGECG